MNIYCISGNISNSLGSDAEHHWNNAIDQQTTLKYRALKSGFETHASFLNEESWTDLSKKYQGAYTRSALLAIESISESLKNIDLDLKESIIIVSTTKGDVDRIPDKLEVGQPVDFYLTGIAQQLDAHFQPGQPTLIISNACISGAQAIQTAASFLKRGKVRNVIVCGVDLMTEFTLAGFNSLKALSNEPCKPFDIKRNGISLGEAAATLVLSKEVTKFNDQALITYDGGIVSNDANHISGPSRTGEGLYQALKTVSQDFKIRPDAISLHGTATIFNDDMESVALHRSGFADIEAFGLKGIYGHTLGCAGVLESIISIYALCHNMIPGTVNFSNIGTVENLNISGSNILKEINTIYKCTSGFGGGNCVLSFSKIKDNAKL